MKSILTLTLLCFLTLLKANTPTINCADDMSVQAQTGACGALVTFEVTSGGTCPGETITQSQGLPSGATFPVGVTINTFVVTDDNGNTDACSFAVSVIDNQAPAFVCVSDTTLVLSQSTCEMAVTYSTPFISDNCNSEPIVLQHNDSNNVSSSFTCDSMSVSSHLRVFDLNDFSVPSAVQVTSIDVGIGFAPNNPTITVNLYMLNGDLSYDNMILLASETATIPALFNTIYNVPMQATIPMGAQVVAELVAPAFSGSTVPGYNDAEGQTAPSYIYSAACGHTNPVDLASQGETDLSLVLMVNTSNTVVEQIAGLESGATFPVGTTLNTFRVTDASGNASTCSFSVNILDQQAPLLVCPNNLEVIADAGACGALVDFDVFAVENCPNEVINIVTGLPSGSFFPVGNTLNTFAVMDTGGNVDTCRFDVTVLDTQAPNIVCPENIIQAANTGNCNAVVNYSIAVEDNCVDYTLQQIAGLPSGFDFPIGTTTNRYVATDGAGNQDTCAFTVTVTDSTLPELMFCPEDMTVSTDASVCEAVVTYPMPVFTDDCSVIDYSLKHNLSDNVTSSYGCTEGGVSSHLRVFDLNSMGVAAALELDSVRVGIGFANDEPEVTLNLYLLTGALAYDNMTLVGTTSATIPNTFNGTFTIPITTAIQAGAILVSELVIPTATNASFVAGYNEGGEITPSYYAAANCGIINPVALSSIGISNLSLVMEVFGHGVAPSMITQTEGLPTGSVFPLGTTQNTFEVMDAAGNTETCSFAVTVNDTEAPSITCPADISVFTGSVTCDTMVVVPQPTFVENCMGTVTWTNSYTNTADASAVYPAGNTIVEWTAMDEEGNSSTCQMMVTVSSMVNAMVEFDSVTPTCFGANDGSATVTANTGNEPYSYLWSTGETTSTATNLSSGIHTVMITDANGCTLIGSISLEEPSAILLDNADITNAITGQNDGSINITISGGTPPYSYLWSEGSTSEDLANVGQGIYEVTVTDANNCTAMFSDFVIEEMVATTRPEIVESLLIAPNPTKNNFVLDIELNTTASVQIQVLNSLGQTIQRVPAQSQLAIRQQFNTQNWSEGLYFVQVILDAKEMVTERVVVLR